jgi:hypothetical protein
VAILKVLDLISSSFITVIPIKLKVYKIKQVRGVSAAKSKGVCHCFTVYMPTTHAKSRSDYMC